MPHPESPKPEPSSQETERSPKEELAALKARTEEFRQELEQAAKTGDLTRARSLKAELQARTTRLKVRLDATRTLPLAEKVPDRGKYPKRDVLLERKETPAKVLRTRIRGRTPEQYVADVQAAKNDADQPMQASDYARSMLENKKEWPNTPAQDVDLLKLRVEDLMTDAEKKRGYLETRELFDNARLSQFGLELAPDEVGPELRIQLKTKEDQPIGGRFWVGMKPITDRDGLPSVFAVGRSAGESRLDRGNARPASVWDPGHPIVFRLRK